MERDSSRGAVQPGLKILARFVLEKQKKISCNRNGISARAEKQETIWQPLGSRSDFSGIKAISNGNRTEWSPIRSVIIRVITKSDDRAAGVRFVYHLVDCYHPKKLKIERRQKAKLRERQCAYFHDSCSRCHFDSPETLRAQSEANISARVEVRHVIATKFQPGLKFAM